ncbi:MAG: hypothetical protein Q8930_09780 [Bacillota bacterium]|nr:hypothetical protein [Bacillota bacterium]
MAQSIYRLKNLVPKHPIQYFLWYTVGKSVCQFGAPFYWVTILGVGFIPVYAIHFIVLILAGLGMYFYYKDKRRNKMGAALIGTIIYFIAAYLPFYDCPRYFYPAMPLVIIFAAAYFAKKFENTRFIKLLE